MNLAQDMWLRGQAAQQNFVRLAAWNAAFMGTAALQTMQLSVHAPVAFWSALGRASQGNGAASATPRAKTAQAAPDETAPKDAAPAAPKAVKPARTAKAAKVAPAPASKPIVVDMPTAKAQASTKPAPATDPAPAAPAAKPAAPAAKASPAPKPAAPAAKAAPAPKPAAPAAKAEAPTKSAPEPKVVTREPAATRNPQLLDAPRNGKADDLTELKGVGAKLAEALNEFGLYHFDQIADLNAEGIDWLNEQQSGFKMIAARYDLVEQAKARVA